MNHFLQSGVKCTLSHIRVSCGASQSSNDILWTIRIENHSTLSITLNLSRVMGKIYSENVENWRCTTSNCFHKHIWTKLIAIWTGSAVSTLQLQSRQLHTHGFYYKWCNQLTLKISENRMKNTLPFKALRFMQDCSYFIDHNPHREAIDHVTLQAAL